MPITYVDALAQFQARSFDALKVAHSAQLASIQAARDLAALAATRAPAFTAGSSFAAATELATSFTVALLEGQIAYAKSLTDAISPAPRPTAGGVSAPIVEVLAVSLPVTVPIDASATPGPLDTVSEPASDETDIDRSNALHGDAPLEITVAPLDSAQPADSRAAADYRESETIAQSAPLLPATEPRDALPIDTTVELLSKTLPAPKSSKSIKVPTVSNNGMPPKRASGKK